MAKYQKLDTADTDTADTDLEVAHSPPAYDIPQNSASPTDFPPIVPTPGTSTSTPSATNFISVIRSSTGIGGGYTIDTSITAAPLGRLFPAEASAASTTKVPNRGAETPNAVFLANNAIELGLRVSRLFPAEASAASTTKVPKRGAKTPNAVFQANNRIELGLRVKGGRTANIKVENVQGRGHVWVDFLHRAPSTPLHLNIAGAGTVRVSLPSSFRGPVAGGSKLSGTIQFSRKFWEIGVTTFSENQENHRDGKYFIGEWETWAGAGGEGQGDGWEGDRLLVTSQGGPVLVQTYEEKEAEDRAIEVKELAESPMRAFWNGFIACLATPAADCDHN